MRILVLANDSIGFYNFRKEFLQRIIAEGHQVYLSCPDGEKLQDLINLGCNYVPTNLARHGTNIIEELKLIKFYKQIMREISPNFVFTYTIKPNIYGGIAARSLKIPYVSTITGLGVAIEKKGLLRQLCLILYRIGLKKSKMVFFQNKDNQNFMISKKIVKDNYKLINGSGVNLNDYFPLEYPKNDNVEFFFIARIMRAKGIEEYIEAAKYCKKNNYNATFHILGGCEENYNQILTKAQEEGILIYHGLQEDMISFYKINHCTINPSYHEGMSNILLESSACCRPSLCSNIAGCKEIIDDNVNGFLFEPKSSKSLIEAIDKFLALSYEQRKQMGINARQKVEKLFNRQLVVDEYMNIINCHTEEKNC